MVSSPWRTVLSLARWLGPWAGERRVPSGVTRDAIDVPGERPFEAWRYQPASRRPIAAVVLVHGLHYAGPADPRLDRFARILAASGASCKTADQSAL